MGISQKQIIASCILLLLITTACAISFNKNNGLSEAEETLQALIAQTTADAIAAESEQSQQKIEDDTEQETTPIELESLPNPFTGSWEGIDPYDGSNTTILLTQTGKELLGIYEDSFSLNIKPPGYYGNGSGTISSNATAQLVFDLSRWDGQTGRFGFHLTLSNDNNTLTISDCLWDNTEDTEDCPMVMHRK